MEYAKVAEVGVVGHFAAACGSHGAGRPGLSLTALGNLNPPGHVVPTDHVCFCANDLSQQPQSPGTGQFDSMAATFVR
jgi:hypothetical protein